MAKAIKLPNKNLVPKAKKGIVPFAFLNPGGGEIYEVGTAIQIIWTGGPALPQNVQLSLVNVNQWTVVNINIPVSNPIGSAPGICKTTIPANFFTAYIAQTKMSPTDRFQFYIQDTAVTTWTYGPEFTIWCSAMDYDPAI